MIYSAQESIITDKETILATFWQRTSAIIIDIVFLGIFYIIIVGILNFFGLHTDTSNMEGFKHIEVTGHGWSTKILATLPTFYFTFLTYFTNGKTLGKWMMRIRIASLYHHRISFWHCLERALGYAVASVELGMGFFQIFWTVNRMCLQDQIAQTVVIKEKRVVKKRTIKDIQKVEIPLDYNLQPQL